MVPIPIIPVTESRLCSMMVIAVRYHQAFVVRDANVARLREICRPFDVEVVEPISAVLPSHEEQLTLVRLLRPAQRDRAMVVPYWPGIPRLLLSRVIQLRLVA